MRIRVDAVSAIMRKRSLLACIELQLLTDRPTGAACARTGCNNIVFDTGSLRGKVGVLVPRSPERGFRKSDEKAAPASNRSTI